MKRVLVIGGGAREHAIAWKILQSDEVGTLILAPGNDGAYLQLKAQAEWMGKTVERWKVDLSGEGFDRLCVRAKEAGVDLTVVGPDDPLAHGICDVFRRSELLILGPSQAAARLESSKSFAKEVMSSAGIPTAKYQSFTDFDEAKAFLEKADWSRGGWVVKADGLALGKGVEVCSECSAALSALERLFPLSQQVVIEEMLFGKEVSWFALCDGNEASFFEPARDYKRVFDLDEGPNTGGMGAFSPVSEVLALEHSVRSEVVVPLLKEMKRRGTPFSGLLYCGLIVSENLEDFWVLEFNARFGDPETQILLPRMDGDLFFWLTKTAKGELVDLPRTIPSAKGAGVYVVAASEGYPDHPKVGQKIEGSLLNHSEDGVPHLFCAGVRSAGDHFETSGGRVLGGVGLGQTILQARSKAYEIIETVQFEGMHFRKDIAT